MWTTSIKQKIRNNENLQVDIVFSNGPKSFEKPFFVRDLFDLKNQINSVINMLTGLDELETTLPTGEFDSTITKDPVSKDETDFKIFISKYQELNGMKKAIEAGIKKESDQDFIDLSIEVKELYKDEYASRI